MLFEDWKYEKIYVDEGVYINTCNGDSIAPNPKDVDAWGNLTPCDGCLSRITGECPNGYNL